MMELDAQSIAESKNKEVIGLESLDEQLSIFESLDKDLLIDRIKEVCKKGKKELREEYGKIIGRYKEGDPKLMEKLRERDKFSLLEGTIKGRDSRLWERSEPLLEDNSLVMLGLAHCPYLIDQAKEKGYQIEEL